jgi:surfactin synthase thioesterase subunit
VRHLDPLGLVVTLPLVCVCVGGGYAFETLSVLARLHHRVSHYRVIGDTCPITSPISIHWRRVKLERVSDYKTHSRHALRMCVTNLVADWAPLYH